jgi:carboxypeptidase Q
MKTHRLLVASLLATFLVVGIGYSQSPTDVADLGMVSRIWEEGTDNSQVMRTLSYLTDVIGPRVPASPSIKRAQAWTARQFEEWGLENVAVEPSGVYGPGWSNEYISVHLTEPSYARVIAFPKPFTPGTDGPIEGLPVIAVIKTMKDIEEHRGTLEGAIVFVDQPREIEISFEPVARRLSESDLGEEMDTPIPVDRPKKDEEKPEVSWQELEEFFRSEKVGVLVESSSATRRDYGSVKVDAYEGEGQDHLLPDRSPRIVMAAESYARICRILDLDVPVTLQIDVRSTIHDQDTEGYNVVAEIPGTDKKDEVVMLGGHLDSWTGGTGAVDNGAGCAITMEAMRILKVLGVQPRRTIRAALWTGEEEAFYGSRGYVIRHFGDTDAKSLENPDWEAYEKNPWRMLGDSTKIIAKPDYEKISGYFNFDSGSGKIRGIYIQENFQVKPIFEAWMKPLRDLGMTTIALKSSSDTDHVIFDWIGIPGFDFIQDPLDYTPQVHHTSQDVYDHCVPEDLIQSAIVMATFVYHTAMREELLPRKPVPIPVEVSP